MPKRPAPTPPYEIPNLNEWSLEFNVMTELKELAESIWWYIRPVTLRSHWSPGYYFPFTNRPKFTILKPAPAAEKGLGYDIHLKPLHADSKSLMLQFKRHHEDKKNPVLEEESKFYNPEKEYPFGHYEFHINNNESTDPKKSFSQHRSLKELVDKHSSELSVLYALPRIKDKAEMEKYAGKLLLRTQFLSILEIDTEAIFPSGGSTPIFSWTEPHRILMNEAGDHWELNYFFFFMKYVDRLPHLVTDMVMLNLKRALAYQDELPDGVTERAQQVAVASYLLHLMIYCGVKDEVYEKHAASFQKTIGLHYPIEELLSNAHQSMDPSMRKKGQDVWKQIAQALNLLESKSLWSERTWNSLNAYKFKTLGNVGQYYGEEYHVNLPDESLGNLSAYIF